VNALLTWVEVHPLPIVLAVLVPVAAVVAWDVSRRRRASTESARRTPAAVVAAGFAAALCTAYSGDISWRFAGTVLEMDNLIERGAMFAAAEVALFSVALMARHNVRSHGAPGTPGTLVWLITGVQVIPAFVLYDVAPASLRAFFGPVCAALLWHLAMGIELRHAKPGMDSQSLPAVLAREVRERLLSRLGVARRGRDAEQITRDRWTVKAVDLAAKLSEKPQQARGRARLSRRLSAAVGKAQAGASPEQKQTLLDLLSARRHAASLATVDLPSPWTVQLTAAQPEPALVEKPVTTVERVPDAVPAVPALAAAVYSPEDFEAMRTALEPVREPLVYPADEPRTEVREYVPDPDWTVPGDYELTATQEDPLTGEARERFSAMLTSGETPSVRLLRGEFSIGQKRAQRIRDELKGAA
jgi:hypothetical protein